MNRFAQYLQNLLGPDDGGAGGSAAAVERETAAEAAYNQGAASTLLSRMRGDQDGNAPDRSQRMDNMLMDLSPEGDDEPDIPQANFFPTPRGEATRSDTEVSSESRSSAPDATADTQVINPFRQGLIQPAPQAGQSGDPAKGGDPKTTPAAEAPLTATQLTDIFAQTFEKVLARQGNQQTQQTQTEQQASKAPTDDDIRARARETVKSRLSTKERVYDEEKGEYVEKTSLSYDLQDEGNRRLYENLVESEYERIKDRMALEEVSKKISSREQDEEQRIISGARERMESNFENFVSSPMVLTTSDGKPLTYKDPASGKDVPVTSNMMFLGPDGKTDPLIVEQFANTKTAVIHDLHQGGKISTPEAIEQRLSHHGIKARVLDGELHPDTLSELVFAESVERFYRYMNSSAPRKAAAPVNGQQQQQKDPARRMTLPTGGMQPPRKESSPGDGERSYRQALEEHQRSGGRVTPDTQSQLFAQNWAKRLREAS